MVFIGFTFLENGEIYSWGRNIYGQLGTGYTPTLFKPKLVSLGI